MEHTHMSGCAADGESLMSKADPRSLQASSVLSNIPAIAIQHCILFCTGAPIVAAIIAMDDIAYSETITCGRCVTCRL